MGGIEKPLKTKSLNHNTSMQEGEVNIVRSFFLLEKKITNGEISNMPS